MNLSIITSLFNCLDYTKKYLDSLNSSLAAIPDLNYEVILIDDCSTDSTREFLKSLKDSRYKIILNEQNSGFAKSNNRGANIASYDNLLFLNNDLVFRDNWFAPLWKTYSECGNVGAVGNIQINPATQLIDHAGIFFDLLGRPAHARKNRNKFPSSDITEWNAVTAACLLISKENFNKVGGFCEDYRNGCEDVDLCVKLKQIGLRNFVANKSIIEHHVSTSPGRHDFNQHNTDIFMAKWSHLTKEWGKSEWAYEYLNRYAKQWWKFNITKLAKAITMLCFPKP